MTTKDLKQISELLDERLDNKLEPIQKTLDGHTKILESHSQTLDGHTKILESHSQILSLQAKTLNSHTKMLRGLKKTHDVMLDSLDGEQMRQSKRLGKIEEHIGL